MSHTIPCLIRKAPFIKTGCGPQGDSTMFVVELSEMTKDYKTGEQFYANYKAMIFAKSPAQIDYYNKALVEGSYVVVSCEKLKVEQRDHNGKVYVTLMMENPRLEGAHFDGNSAPKQQVQQQQMQQQQPMQQQPQRQPQAQQQYSPQQQMQQPTQQMQQPVQNGQFDDSIPF